MKTPDSMLMQLPIGQPMTASREFENLPLTKFVQSDMNIDGLKWHLGRSIPWALFFCKFFIR